MDFEKLKEKFKDRLDKTVFECYGCCEGLIKEWTIGDLIEELEEQIKKVPMECPICHIVEFAEPGDKCWRCNWPLKKVIKECPQADYDGHPCYRCKVKNILEEHIDCPHNVVSERGEKWWEK